MVARSRQNRIFGLKTSLAMLTTVKGTYTDGRITFHETPPPVVSGPVEVIVTFLAADEDTGKVHLRIYSRACIAGLS
jgi:hypothetical protein